MVFRVATPSRRNSNLKISTICSFKALVTLRFKRHWTCAMIYYRVHTHDDGTMNPSTITENDLIIEKGFVHMKNVQLVRFHRPQKLRDVIRTLRSLTPLKYDYFPTQSLSTWCCCPSWASLKKPPREKTGSYVRNHSRKAISTFLLLRNRRNPRCCSSGANSSMNCT